MRENSVSEDVDTDADKYFEPLRAACESRVAKVMEIALDAIHILIGIGNVDDICMLVRLTVHFELLQSEATYAALSEFI